jgi:hypothetical protein
LWLIFVLTFGEKIEKKKKKKKKKKTESTPAKKVFAKRRHSSGDLSPSSLIAAANDAIADSIVVSDVAVRTRQLQLECESRRGRKRRSLAGCHDDANSASSSECGAGVAGTPTAATPVKRAFVMQQRAHFHDVDEIELEVELVPDELPPPPPEPQRRSTDQQDFDAGENFGDSNRVDSNRSAAAASVSIVSKSKSAIETASATAPAAVLADLLPRKKAPARTFSARRKPPHTDTEPTTTQ